MSILSFGTTTPSDGDAFFKACQGTRKIEDRSSSYCWKRLSENMNFILQDYCLKGTAECSESEFMALSKLFQKPQSISYADGSLEIEVHGIRPRDGEQMLDYHDVDVQLVYRAETHPFTPDVCLKDENFDHARCQGRFYLDVDAESIMRLQNRPYLKFTATSKGGSQAFQMHSVREIFASTPDSFHNPQMGLPGGVNGRYKSGGPELTFSYWFRPNDCSPLIEFGVLISFKSKTVIYVFPGSRAEKLGIKAKKFSLFRAEAIQDGLVSFEFVPIDILDKLEFGLKEVCAKQLLEKPLDDAVFAERFYPNFENFDKLEEMLGLLVHLADLFGDYVAEDILDFSYGRFQGTWDINGERVRLMSLGHDKLIGLSSDRSTYFSGAQNNNAIFLYQYEVRAGDLWVPIRRNEPTQLSRRMKLANVVRAIFGVRNGNNIDAMSLDQMPSMRFGVQSIDQKCLQVFLMQKFKQLQTCGATDRNDFERKCHGVSGASILTANIMNHDYWHRYFPHRMEANRDDPKDLEFFRVVKKHRCKKYRRDSCMSRKLVRDDPEYHKEGPYTSSCYWPQTAIKYDGAIMKPQTLETRLEMIAKIQHREEFAICPETTQREELRMKSSGSRKERRNRINRKRKKVNRTRKKRDKKRTQLRTAETSFKMKPLERSLYFERASDWDVRPWVYYQPW